MQKKYLLLLLLNLLYVTPVFSSDWQQLAPLEKKALRPLEAKWASFDSTQQNHLIAVAQQFQKLTPEQQQRVTVRLIAWSELTPSQREAAREKYLAFSKVPEEKKQAVKQMIQQNKSTTEQTY
jgi:Protein of unknown function (DUF3106)